LINPEAAVSVEGASAGPALARKLGLFDAVMLVMGGIIGSGIFINSYVVARQVHTPALILGAWAMGGLIALLGAFIYAELATRQPEVGGQYAYLRDAYHPAVAFLYGWVLLLVIQTGGMAAVSITFAKYFLEATQLPVADSVIAIVTLLILTLINCLGVRAGSTFQSFLMVLKIAAIIAVVSCGIALIHIPYLTTATAASHSNSTSLIPAFGAAMAPVMFAFGGWQTATFISGELKDPRRDLARGLVVGIIGVILLYLAMNIVYVGTMGSEGLAQTTTPASTLMRQAFGNWGAILIALVISISTLGFLSQGMLTAPRVYFAMAKDGLFFKSVAWVHPRSRVPVVAIAMQGILAAIIAVSGRYEAILNYVVSVDFIAFGLTATCIFIFRRRQQLDATSGIGVFRTPGHPITTILFIVACWLVVISTVYQYPRNTILGLLILIAGMPVYLFWSRRKN
jgi:basic amino acid/polyamine antiporter, APA family